MMAEMLEAVWLDLRHPWMRLLAWSCGCCGKHSGRYICTQPRRHDGDHRADDEFGETIERWAA